MKKMLVLILLLVAMDLFGQRLPDHVYAPTIQGVKLFQQNNQLSQPILQLNSSDQLELHFDDIIK
jgi:hypothetical protein